MPRARCFESKCQSVSALNRYLYFPFFLTLYAKVPVQLCEAALLDHYPPPQEEQLFFNAELNVSSSQPQIRLNYRRAPAPCAARNRL